MGNIFNIAGQVNLDAARIGFHVAFLQALEAAADDPLKILFTEISSMTTIEEWEWLGDLPGFEEWKGDRKLGDLDAQKLRIENKDWSVGLRVHQNQFKDDKLGLFAARVAGLAEKARRHRYDLMVKMLLNGFDGNNYPEVGNGLAYDGAFFFSDAHTTSGGPNQSNKLTEALSAAGLENAVKKFRALKTADGKDPLDLKGTHLIVGPKLEAVARKLLENEIVPTAAGTATEANIHRGRFQLLVSNRIAGAEDDYWFVADMSAPVKPFIFQSREDISTSAIVGQQGGEGDSVPRFQRGELWFGAEARYNVGYFAWQTVVGSEVA